MKINKAELSIVAVRRSQYPTNNLPEFLLIGRSNVGKSSFINAVLERKGLARTSSRPGRTQTLNFFNVNDSLYFVDAPGYGYAQVDRKTQEKFGKMIEEYLEKRTTLKRVFMLVDARMKPTEDDCLMYNFLKYYNIPVTIIGTKLDKVGGSKLEQSKKNILSTLDLVVDDNLIMFSSLSKVGKVEIQNLIESLIQ